MERVSHHERPPDDTIMDVTVEHFEERSDPGALEDVSYEYVYVVYLFRDGDRSLSVRRNRDEPEASLELRWKELAGMLDLLPEVLAWLDQEGVRSITAHNPQQGGYSALRVSAEYARRLGYITAEQQAFLKSLPSAPRDPRDHRERF
jgi:ribosomal protein S18 acetylase RimI-like enzyme